ncbi:hypothetical protein Aperf_G00000076838 [Anoplocephala perfoliata]
MSRRTTKAIVVYDLHPHVAIFRELAGYKNTITEEISDEDNTDYLRSLEPNDWKTNDHYAVLNLKKQRYKASDEAIRKQYRRIVLLHHPDKRRARGEDVKDISHDYFRCITQAFEILGNPSKRFAYDSVDPFLPNPEPTLEEIKEDFFGAFQKFFMEKSRWSKHQPTPFLGHSQTPIEHVLRFYDFWETYETTKDFSFLDEEDLEKADDRDHRRYLDRLNRADRQRRRNEELKKVHQILDLARSLDPRIIAADKAARDAKEARKRERLEAIQRRKEEEAFRIRAEAAAAEAARAADAQRQRLEAEAQKKEREQAKAQARKEKRRLKDICGNRYDHFIAPARSENPELAEDSVKVQTLQDIDLLCHALSTMQLSELNKKLESARDATESFEIWKEELVKARKQFEAPGLRATVSKSSLPSQNGTSSKWTFEMTQILIKAVNLFPAGTQKRWDVIAAYVNQHSKGAEVTGKEALKQAKCVNEDYGAMKQETNAKAFDNFASSTKQSDATKSVTITNQIEAEADRPWTLTEQKALETALRVNPAKPGETPSERWKNIANMVGTRTSKECLQRYKYLAEQIKLKRAAQTAAGVSIK